MGKKLSSKICSLVLSGLFAVSAVSPNSIADDPKTIANTKSFGTALRGGCKELYKRHPALCTTGIVIVSVVGGAVLFHVGVTSYWKWCTRDIKTKIDGYSKEQVASELEKEIEKYKSRAPEIFKVDEELLDIDKRFLLLTFMQLNYLFDKYSGFTRDFIEFKNRQTGNKKTFLFRPFHGFEVSTETIAAVRGDLSEIMINIYGLACNLYEGKNSVESGHSMPHKIDELIEYYITHEFGHLLEYTYLYTRGRGSTALDIKNAITKGIQHPESMTSEYGKTNEREFFAEVFAHLECSDPENVNELGKAMDKFLVETMCYRTLTSNENI